MDGIEDWCSDAWKIGVNDGATSKDISFSRFEGICFGSVYLCTSSVAKSCETPSQFIAIGDMSEKGGPCIGEGVIAASCVKYYVKYLLRMSVFPAV